MRNLDAPQSARKPVSRRYCRSDDQRVKTGNSVRLQALARLLKLSASDIARASGFSRCYVSRLLSPNDPFTGSPEFFRSLEMKLGAVIDARSSQFFTCPAVSVARARAVLEQLP